MTDPAALRLAVRENRRGRVRLSHERVADGLGRSLLGRLYMVSEEPGDAAERFSTWEAYAPEFDPLEVGHVAPVYNVSWQADVDGKVSVHGFVRQALPGTPLEV